MSTAPPGEFRSYLIEAHAVNGPKIPDRPSHAQFIESCRQDGLTDGDRGIFDKHSFALQAPTTFEHRCSSWLDVAFTKAIDDRHDDLHAARDIMARTEAACAQVEGQRHQSEKALAEVEQEIEETRAVLRDPGHPLYDPLAEMLSSPEPVDATETKRLRKAPTPWSHRVRRAGSWLGQRPWFAMLLWPFLVAGEIGLIYQITQSLGDGLWTGRLLAVSLSALAVAIAWLAVPALVQAGASRARQILSAVALILYVAAMVALGWLRYLTSRPDVVALVDEAAVSTEAVVFPWFGNVLLFLLWVALPLGLTAVIALLHTRHSTAEQHDPADTESDPDGSSPEAAEAEPADLTSSARAAEVDPRIRHQQDQLLAHLRSLRLRRAELQDQIIHLQAEEVYAQAALGNARLNEEAIDERARLHVQSLPQAISDGFLSYLKGLEQGLGDPTMTAYLQEAAQAFLSRYAETAETKVNGFLVYLDEHPLSPAVPAAATGAV